MLGDYTYIIIICSVALVRVRQNALQYIDIITHITYQPYTIIILYLKCTGRSSERRCDICCSRYASNNVICARIGIIRVVVIPTYLFYCPTRKLNCDDAYMEKLIYYLFFNEINIVITYKFKCLLFWYFMIFVSKIVNTYLPIPNFL